MCFKFNKFSADFPFDSEMVNLFKIFLATLQLLSEKRAHDGQETLSNTEKGDFISQVLCQMILTSSKFNATRYW